MRQGAWEKLFGHFCEDANGQDVAIDGSVVRALGRSKGGFSGKIHALCDALGMPIKFILTGGQKAECQQAIPLLENVKASAVLADKAYDTDELRTWLTGRGIKAVISLILDQL
ncbi:transposase (fragment) [Candidatus Methylobacter favarea]|uniref:Transposase n=1 Tax=Candidatus Methylobacter favarea TaxID=2707345 RepID=A0A8S0Y688_9GAMM